MKKEIKDFLGKHLIAVIDICGGIVFFVTFIPAFFVEELAQSILFSLSINILTSLLILTFVDRIIDLQHKKEDAQKNKENEKKKILRYYKSLEYDLKAYIVEFNQITTPFSKRENFTDRLPFQTEKFNANFTVQDLIDFDMLDMTIYGRYSKKAIVTFSEFQNNLYAAFDKFIKDIDFEYFSQIEKDISEIILSKNFPNSLENLKLFVDVRLENNKEFKKILREQIQQYKGNPLDDIDNGKYSGNILINILTFYVFLILISANLNKFIEDIKILQEDL